jgi:TetR/AcrR family transcriptional repressor of nem operon
LNQCDLAGPPATFICRASASIDSPCTYAASALPTLVLNSDQLKTSGVNQYCSQKYLKFARKLTFVDDWSNLIFKLINISPMNDTFSNVNHAERPVPRNRQQRSTARTDTRRALVWCGTELLTERGFQITGIDEVLKRVGVPKGSFYYFFKSKDDFGEAVIKNYADYYSRKMDRIFNDQTCPPMERLKAFVNNAKYGMSKFEFRRGCLIGNLGQDLASLDGKFRHILEAVLLSWEARVTACLQDAIDVGDIGSSNDAHALSRFFWIGWEGAILRSKLMRSLEPIDHFADLYFAKIAT